MVGHHPCQSACARGVLRVERGGAGFPGITPRRRDDVGVRGLAQRYPRDLVMLFSLNVPALVLESPQHRHSSAARQWHRWACNPRAARSRVPSGLDPHKLPVDRGLGAPVLAVRYQWCCCAGRRWLASELQVILFVSHSCAICLQHETPGISIVSEKTCLDFARISAG